MTASSPGQWSVPPQPPLSEPLSKRKAALFAFFLGVFGVHNFYLGQRKRGFGHIVLLGVALAGLLAAMLYMLFIVFWYSDLYLGNTMDRRAEVLLNVLVVLPLVLIGANLAWAIIEGIAILAGRSSQSEPGPSL